MIFFLGVWRIWKGGNLVFTPSVAQGPPPPNPIPPNSLILVSPFLVFFHSVSPSPSICYNTPEDKDRAFLASESPEANTVSGPSLYPASLSTLSGLESCAQPSDVPVRTSCLSGLGLSIQWHLWLWLGLLSPGRSQRKEKVGQGDRWVCGRSPS